MGLRLSNGLYSVVRERAAAGWGGDIRLEVPTAEEFAALDLRVQAELALLLAIENPAGILDDSEPRKFVGGVRTAMAKLLKDVLGQDSIENLVSTLEEGGYVGARRGRGASTLSPEWLAKFEGFIRKIRKELNALEAAKPTSQSANLDEDHQPGAEVTLTLTSLAVLHARRRSIEGMADDTVAAILRRLEEGGQVPVHVMPYLAELLRIVAPALAGSEADVMIAALRKLETIFADGVKTIEPPM